MNGEKRTDDEPKLRGPWFFIGVGGSGMSALAQFLSFRGDEAGGSDRDFARDPDSPVRRGLEKAGVSCFPQDTSGLTDRWKTVIYSTAIEADHPELLRAKELGCEVVHRSELLSFLSGELRTIAVAGTSGKSTVTAMIFHILQRAGFNPSLITGAGLTELEEQGWIGNAWGGAATGKEGAPGWLVIEADESDGSIVRYSPEIGVLLNIDRDHKEPEELLELFAAFASRSRTLCVNRDHPAARRFSETPETDFSLEPGGAGTSLASSEPLVDGGTRFRLSGTDEEGEDRNGTAATERATAAVLEGTLAQPGLHNLSNALAAIAAARAAGVATAAAVAALADFRGIRRRYERVGESGGVRIVDDFAHNPAKIAAAVATAQSETPGGRLLAWFQPHGFAPARFMRQELTATLAPLLRPDDLFWFSEIHFAGGTVTRNISGKDLADDLRAAGAESRFAADRNDALREMVAEARPGDLILLMGARDPSLDNFAREGLRLLKNRPSG